MGEGIKRRLREYNREDIFDQRSLCKSMEISQ
jgi:hypothetical protein